MGPVRLATTWLLADVATSSTTEVPTMVLGVGALVVAALSAAWAWMCRVADRERDGDDRGILASQALIATALAVVAAGLGVVWIVTAVHDAGGPVWLVPLIGVAVAGVVVLVARRS